MDTSLILPDRANRVSESEGTKKTRSERIKSVGESREQNRRSGTGKTNEAIDLVLKNIGVPIELGGDHQKRVFEIMDQGCSGMVGVKLLSERTVDHNFSKAQNVLVKYARSRIQDQTKILALVMMICEWVVARDADAYFLYAGSCVQLLKELKSSLYRGALLIYQSTLFEKGEREKVFDILFNLPIVSASSDKKDNYHAKSAWLMGCAYQVLERYAEARNAFCEINKNNNDSWVYVSWANQAINELELLEGNGSPLNEEEIGILEPLVKDEADSERGGTKLLEQNGVKVEYGACKEAVDLDQLMKDVIHKKSVAMEVQDQREEEEDCCCVMC